VAGNGRLADALPQADDGERRDVNRLERRRLEPEVRPDVGEAERERARRPEQALARVEHGLVGEVDDDVHLHRGERVDERHAVVLPADDLLGPPDEERCDDLVRQRCERIPHDRRVVLAVDEDERPPGHVERTSSSILAVYFSYVFVSVENWMIRSCSWNGYFRQTLTCVPSTSTTL
jgi:hypothetical protein